MAGRELISRLSIPDSSSDRTKQALGELQKRLTSEDGQLLVKAFGEMATTRALLSLNPSATEHPIDQLTDTDLVNTLFDGTDDGIDINLGKDPQIYAAIDNDPDVNKTISQARLLKAGTPEIHLGRRAVSAHLLRVFGEVATAPHFAVVAQDEINPDGLSTPLHITDEAKIA